MITLTRPLQTPPGRREPPPETDGTPDVVARARVFGGIIALLFLALIGRLWFLQIVHGADFRDAAASNQARRIRTRAPRGVITDRNGVLLAANRARFAVYATPDVLKNAVVLRRLAALLGETPESVTEILAAGRQNPFDPIRIALDVPMKTVTQIEENRPFLPGVSTDPEPVRWYPRGAFAANVLGTMGRIDGDEFQARKQNNYFRDDFLGKTGIEKQYEDALHGTPGGTDVQIDAKGRKTRVLATESAKPGATVTLTLDSKLQTAAENALRARGLPGAAVAIDPRTGAVLASASAPTFDPDKFAVGIKTADWKPLSDNPNHPLIDRAMDAMYPPGSTFKPIVAAAGLETGTMTTSTSAYCPGFYRLGSARFGCWSVHHAVNFYSAMEDSCDVFFYQAGKRLGPDAISKYARAFGLAEKTGVDLPEDIGSIPSPNWKKKRFAKLGPAYTKWQGGDTLHMAIGQGDVLVTPLQMARVTATLANGGDVLKPFVVEKITDGVTGKKLAQATRTVVRHVPISDAHLEDVRRAMRATVISGTAKIVKFDGLAVAGKTGSAQTHGAAKTHGWFICFAPYDHPTIAIAAVVEHGGHGGDTAGRVARAMLQTYFHLKAGEEKAAKSD